MGSSQSPQYMTSPHYETKNTPLLPRIPERPENAYDKERDSDESESDDEWPINHTFSSVFIICINPSFNRVYK